MIDPATWHIWSYRLLFLGLAFVIMVLRLLPLGLGDAGLPSPDILLALALAWMLRQPAVIPIGSIVVVFLLADFLFQKPPGLTTMLLLLASEWLKARRTQMTEVNFLVEWASVTSVIFALLLIERVALWLLIAPQVSLGLALVHGLMTAAIYPIVVLVSHYVFGLRRLGPAETDPVSP